MGYIKHDAIIVEGWDGFDQIHRKAKSLLGDIGGHDLVSPIVGPTVNGTSSFLVAPDGSKEGWNTSDQGDAAREEFLHWLAREANFYATAVAIRFGGDDSNTSIRVVRSKRSMADA